MKKLSLVMLSITIVGLMMTFSSCQNNPANPSGDMFSSSEFQLPVTDNTESDLQDATETNDFMLLPPTGYNNEDCQFMGWGSGRGSMMDG